MIFKWPYHLAYGGHLEIGVLHCKFPISGFLCKQKIKAMDSIFCVTVVSQNESPLYLCYFLDSAAGARELHIQLYQYS